MVAGRVAVNGRPVTELGTRVDPDKDTVAVDGVTLETTLERRVTLMLNKPRGYECAAVPSGAGLRSVYDLLRDVPERVVPAGRLDADSEGLLLFSNDGDLIHRITHPRHGHRKVYEVDIAGRVSPSTLGRLGERMEIDGYRIEPVRVERLPSPPGGRGDRLRFTLGEGRNRQIRKMCGLVGLKVLTLRRVAIQGLRLGSLPSGAWRMLTAAELQRLQATATPNAA